jgi:class 3 adenylate cyclase
MLEPTDPGRRVDDTERERAIEVLRRHTGDGRLTLDEFSDRAGEVYAATTLGQLEKVTADLPVLATTTVLPEGRRRRATRFTMSLMGGHKRTGRWRVADRTVAIAVMGGTELDLRNAEFDGDEIHITALAVMGGIDIVVPEGVEVELSGLAIMGGKDSKVRPAPRVPGAPVVRVFALALMGGVTIRNKRERSHKQHHHHDKQLQQREQRQLRRENRRDELTPAQVAALPEGTVTVMFTDIEASTALFERVGDSQARSIISLHNRIIRGEVARLGGTEVKNQGDGFMIVFRSAAAALRAAVAIQTALLDPLPGYPDEVVRVRIGLHAGDLETHEGDMVGLAVTTASRITDEAAGGEILASSIVRDLAGQVGKELDFGDGRIVDLKGMSLPVTVHPVAWRR